MARERTPFHRTQERGRQGKIYSTTDQQLFPLTSCQIWNKTVKDGSFSLELIRQLNHIDTNREGESNVSAGITYILPMPQVVYTGDEDGRVVRFGSPTLFIRC